MTAQAVSICVSAAFVLAGVAISLAALWRASCLLRAAAAPTAFRASDAAIDVLQKKLEALEADLQELRQRPAGAPAPHIPRPGMNLDRRSQALRMHRRGESPAQIAAALDIPLQEVDLLMKVHRIVLRSI